MGLSAGWFTYFSIQMTREFTNKIFSIKNDNEFLETALAIFKYQYENNKVYHSFIKQLGKDPSAIKTIADIPFLPIEFFRNHKVTSGDDHADVIFESSRTTGKVSSKHYVHDRAIYEESFSNCFRLFYGDPEEYFIGALLPSYLEQKNSSLVYMMNELIKKSSDPSSGFFKENLNELIGLVNNALQGKKKVFLIGVSFALLDLAMKGNQDFREVILMETGGMKGRRKELTREELHSILKNSLNVQTVHSEYGMTELLSQAYSKGNGIFECPPWMKVMIRDPLDPLTIMESSGRTGGINVIDLANIFSCSFLATGDLGKRYSNGSFEVLGRFDNSDIRGCNLMIE